MISHHADLEGASCISTIAIIPVRGGSVGIPRKNARLLAGKPLLAHALGAALRSEEIDVVYVSTDDEELAEIARRFGALVLPRAAVLATSKATLDEVVVATVRQLEEGGVKPAHVVTIQATCPLLSTATIDRAVRTCKEEQCDTVLSVVDDRHLTWGREEASGRIAPEYTRRVNRQELPARFRETGGVVVCRREILETGTRFGSRVSVVEVSKKESLDIDDAFDWWLAEKALLRRRICLRVIGARDTGLGHVTRALTIADRLIDHDVCFLAASTDELAVRMIRARFHTLYEVAPGSELAWIAAERPDLVVNDILDTDAEYMQAVRALGVATINFEDLGPGSLSADFVINEMYDEHPERLDGRVFSGVEHCVLRDEFYTASPVRIRDSVENVLLLFGGTDPSDLTHKCLSWLEGVEGDFKVTVILGLGHPNPDSIRQLAERSRREVTVVVNSGMISRYMAQADFAVTSAGRTVFELASLGVPMLVIPQNDRECQHGFATSSPGVISLPRASELGEEQFLAAARDMVESRTLRLALHRVLMDVKIRNGIDQVMEVISKALKRT